MTIADFFREAPVLSTILALAYLALMGVFIYMFIKMYRKSKSK